MFFLQRFTWIRIFIFVIVAATFVAPYSFAESDKHAAEEGGQGRHGDEDDHNEELVQLSPEVLKEFDVQIAIAKSEIITHRVSLPGEVRPNQDHLSHITPRFSGIVKEVRKAIGDHVKPGDTLAIIESSQTLTTFPLKTLIEGVVIAKHITPGEPISPEGDIAFTVADLSDVWIDISVYPKEMHLVQLGQDVRISPGHNFPTAHGTISYVAPIVDEKTRTSTARVVLSNQEGIWRPGMFVSTSIEVTRREVEIGVPRTAIEMLDGSPVIFVQEHDGFEQRPVVLGAQGVDYVEVIEGIKAGESYVAKGGFTIKSELAREELSGGHSH